MTAPGPQPQRLSAVDLRFAVQDGEGLPRWVLLDASAQFQAGTLTLLTGDNGAGKTTLLALLAGEQPPAGGQILLDGVALPQWTAADLAQRIAVLGHKPGLYLDLSARENLALLTALTHTPATGQLEDALRQVGLQPADWDRPVRGFSRGMLQRAALARILLSGADIWLLDEPSTGLDRSGLAVLGQLLGLARSRGATLVVTTHEPGFLPPVDQHLHLQRGRLVAGGRP
jgi:heme ABC exporter ATP-binding subunit CcmA